MKLTAKNKLMLIIILILLLSIPLGIYLVKQQQKLKSQATHGIASLIFVPASATIIPGRTQTVDIFLNPAESIISGVDLTVKFDKNKLTVDESAGFRPTSAFSDTIIPSSSNSGIDNIFDGTLRYVALAKTDQNVVTGNNIKLGTIVFKATSTAPVEGETTIRFENVIITVSGGNRLTLTPQPATYFVGVIASPSPSPSAPVSPSPSPSRSPTPSPSISPSPSASSSPEIGAKCSPEIAFYDRWSLLIQVGLYDRDYDCNEDTRIDIIDYNFWRNRKFNLLPNP